jgi:hypothetical protein
VADERLKLVGLEFPEGELVALGFQEEPVSVFQGDFAIRADIETADAPETGAVVIVRIELTLQACDDEKCLRPETLTLELPVTGPS